MVCPMPMRMYAAGLAVIAAVSSVVVPDQAFGRSGGFGGRSFSIARGFRSPVLQRPLVFRSPALRQSLFLHRHRFGFGAPLTGPIGPYYDGWDSMDPSYQSAMGPYDQSSYVYRDGAAGEIPSGFNPPVVRHRGCESESVTVPSEHGGKRTVNVNIVRCY
jgi:hypothetical protein